MDNGEENRLKQSRIHMNMTQQQMADLLKAGQNTYSRTENGVTAFKDVYKKIIEDKYHLTTGWLSGADVPMFKKYDAVAGIIEKGISGSNKEKLKEEEIQEDTGHPLSPYPYQTIIFGQQTLLFLLKQY